MKGRLALSFTIVIVFFILRYYTYEGREIYFDIAQFLVFSLSIVTIGRSWVKNRGKNSIGYLLMEQVEKKFGRAYASYLRYELRLLVGLFHFILAPIKNYRAVMKSYFATEKLKSVFIAIPFLLFLETGLIHLLISDQSSGMTALILHAVLIVSEIYLCEILLGNLYHLQNSSVTLDEQFHVKMGIMWEFKVPIEDIDRLEVSQRTANDKTPKISLLHDELVRIHFKRKITATKHFRSLSFDQADIFLQRQDQERLKAALSAKAS